MTIKHSEQLNEIFLALSKLQGKIENAKRDADGYNKNYKYAKLDQYIELSRELLEEHGLCVLQMPGCIEIVEVTKEVFDKKTQTAFFQQVMMPKQMVSTWIGHKSGQFISSDMEMLVEKTTINSWGQSTGVAVSFMRRYALAGKLGMTQEDDDNQLSKQDVEKSYTQQKPLKAITQQNSVKAIEYDRISADQVNYFKGLLVSDPERLNKVLVWAKAKTLEDLSVSAYTEAVNILLDEQKGQSAVANAGSSFISEDQAALLKRLVTSERLIKILEDYKINKIEEMNVADYYKEYDKLRLEMTTDIVEEKEFSSIKQ